MTVPLVQGSLRYAYKIGMDPSARSKKNAAEGATFSAAVLPLVNYCNPASAKIISDNQKFGLYDAGTFPDFAAVKTAFESTYACLGITCDHVGGLTVGTDAGCYSMSTHAVTCESATVTKDTCQGIWMPHLSTGSWAITKCLYLRRRSRARPTRPSPATSPART
jgi:hypothetical protein